MREKIKRKLSPLSVILIYMVFVPSMETCTRSKELYTLQTILALAYMLCHLLAMRLQLQCCGNY